MNRKLWKMAASAAAVGTIVLTGGTAHADPAVELPDGACNDGTARAGEVASENANSPVWPHGTHGCHVHLP